MISIIKVFSFALLIGISSSLNAQTIVVPVGTTHSISTNQTVDNVTVNGTLIINPDYELTVTSDLTINSGGIMSLSHHSDLTVEGLTQIEETGLLLTTGRGKIRLNELILNSGRIIINSSSNVEIEGNSSWIGNAEIAVNEQSFFRVNGNLQSQGPVKCLMSATCEIAFNGHATFDNVDNIKFKYGKLGFSGGRDQTVMAPRIETDNLVLYGSTLRLVTTDTVRISNKLTLYSGVIISNNAVKILNTQGSAIERSTGYVVAPSLTRVVDSRDTYTFPVGTLSYPSAVQIIPFTNALGEVTVELLNGVAGNLSERPSQVTSVNNTFYHKIYKRGEVSDVDLAIYYPSSLPTSFNKVMNYIDIENTWGLMSSYSSSLNLSPNLYGVSGRRVKLAERKGEPTVNANYFVLAATQQPEHTTTSYAVLKKKLDGGYLWVPDGILRFQFEEEYPEDNDQLMWKVYDAKQIPKQTGRSYPVKYGDNRYEIDITSLVSIGYGVLEISNNKNEKWYLRFKSGGF